MPPPLLLLQDIQAYIGSTRLLEGASLSVGAGERVCIVGRNGSGKSTLLRIAAGEIDAAGGTVFRQPGTTMRWLEQEPDLSRHASIGDYVASGLGPGDSAERARRLLEDFGLDPDRAPLKLSGGEVRRAALARVLAPDPDILLLDEPTNHLDLPAIAYLEEALARSRAALVLISHDRRFLETLSRSVIWLDRGTTRVMERGFAHFETWREEVLAAEEVEAQKLARQIVREEDWLRYGVTARRKRNVRRLAQLHELRAAHRNRVRAVGQVSLSAEVSQSGGRMVAAADAISIGFHGRVLVRDFSTRIMRGDRVGLIGPNGAGKTTLLNLLTGRLQPDSGSIALGAGIEMVTLEQMRESLDPAKTLAETLTAGSGEFVQLPNERRHVVGYMKDFLFRPEQARTPVGVLSGGERGRLLLAVALSRRSNLMVLDEPTNDLDLDTLDLLQDMLAEYAGTVLLVSHDRDFLDRVVTSTIAAEGDGVWVEYAGGYTDMIRQRGAALPPGAPRRGDSARQAPPAAPRARAAPAQKMTFKDKHALQTLPAEIERLSARIAAHEAKLADPAFFTRDPAGFTATMDALKADHDARAAAEERWLELEMLRESLEGSG